MSNPAPQISHNITEQSCGVDSRSSSTNGGTEQSSARGRKRTRGVVLYQPLIPPRSSRLSTPLLTFAVKQNILGLEVAIDDIQPVYVLQSEGNLRRVEPRSRLGKLAQLALPFEKSHACPCLVTNHAFSIIRCRCTINAIELEILTRDTMWFALRGPICPQARVKVTQGTWENQCLLFKPHQVEE